ncbi:MAG TPA: outer membrane beta-barrel protein [Candidatus Sulfotelmatobacter sp.]|nr:outer membrane beta-barrel protein [Candidatus Sulfotelmatobacter sp.]
MPRHFSVILAVTALIGVATAQSSESSSRVEVFGGFSYLTHDFSLTTANGLKGWDGSATFKVARYVGVTADFSGYYPSGCCGTNSVHTYLFGPQVSFRLQRVSPFVQFLMGGAHISFSAPGAFALASDKAFLYAFGGGIDYSLTRRLALRGQVDWLHSGYETWDSQGSDPPNGARIVTGVVIRF